MSVSLLTLTACAVLTFSDLEPSETPPPAEVEGSAAAANGAIVLDGVIPPPPVAADDAAEAAEADAVDPRDEAMPPAEPAPAVEPAAPPAFESTRLGAANDALSARPAGGGEPSEGRLATLDPRRNETVRVAGALAAVLGLLVLLRLALKRSSLLGGGRPSGVLEVLARYPIARGQSLVIIKMARRVVLVHHAGTVMTALSEVSEPDEVAALLGRMEAGAQPRGATRFSQALRDFERDHDRVGGRAFAPGIPDDAEIEVVDLTRSQVRGLGGLLGRKGGAR
jgi:flagellar biogenesis protein FliO